MEIEISKIHPFKNHPFKVLDDEKISWNGAAEKYDIRDWAPEHEKMGKGITLSQEEAEALYELLGKTLKK